MLKKIATATSAIAILAGYALPGAAQSIYNEPTKTPTAAPSTEMQPTMQPSTTPPTEAQPLSPSSAPTTPTPEVAPVTPETTPTTPSTEMQPPSTPAPSTETQPAVPPTPSTSTPVTSPSAEVNSPSAEVKPTEMTAKTTVLEGETITGIKEVSFPTPPTTPAFFTLPIELRVLKDASVTSNTPITDKNSRDLSAWASAVRACAMDKPAFVRVVGDQQVPFMINGTEGKVRLNANDKPVCSA